MTAVRVLYVAGYVRSGSTLLDRMLGSVEGITSLGEMSLVWEYGLEQDRPCSCTVPFSRCAFWGPVIHEAFGPLDPGRIDEIVRVRRRVDRWWRLPFLGDRGGSAGFRRDLAAHRDNLLALYRAIARVTGGDVIVDSTKEATHLRLLRSLAPEVDVRVAHLIRDSRAVTYSLHERDKHDPATGHGLGRHSVAHAAAAWGATNLMVEAVARGASRRVRIRYEDLASDPVATIRRLVRLVDVPTDVRSMSELGRHRVHSVAGNPIRFDREPIVVRTDDEWRARMSPADRWLVTGMTWPLLAAYRRSATDLDDEAA